MGIIVKEVKHAEGLVDTISDICLHSAKLSQIFKKYGFIGIIDFTIFWVLWRLFSSFKASSNFGLWGHLYRRHCCAAVIPNWNCIFKLNSHKSVHARKELHWREMTRSYNFLINLRISFRTHTHCDDNPPILMFRVTQTFLLHQCDLFSAVQTLNSSFKHTSLEQSTAFDQSGRWRLNWTRMTSFLIFHTTDSAPIVV